MKTFLISTGLFFFFSFNVFSQKIKVGVSLGDNFTYTSVSSDKNINTDISYRPNIGNTFGIITRKELSSKICTSFNLLYDKRRDLDVSDIQLRDDFGTNLGKLPNRKIINHYLKAEINFAYQIIKGFAIGSGVNLYFLMDSKTKYKSEKEKNKFNNYHYRPFNFTIPIFLSYTFRNFTAQVVFDKGILSRIKDNSSFIKERENTLTVRVGYYFL